jgi:ABC-type sugar transport system permease subunit
MILLLAGLQTIPDEIYEAAAVDGASPWGTFWRMTLPLMKFPLAIVLVLLTIVNFNTLVAMLVLTGGGPGRATNPPYDLGRTLGYYDELWGHEPPAVQVDA